VKIITRGVIDWGTLQIEEEDSYEYEGPIARAKDSGAPPQAVDPWTQAAAQYGLSTGTAQFNAGLNRTNQNNPLGSSYWTTNQGMPPGGGSGQTPEGGHNVVIPGSSSASYPSYSGGFGLGGSIPSSSAGTPAPIPTAGTAANPFGSYYGNFGGSSLATPPTYTLNTQLAPQFQSLLQKPIDTSGLAGMPGGPSTTQDLTDTRNALYGEQQQYLAPEQKLASDQLKAQLANEGATPGSPAYNTEMDRLSREQEFQNSSARMQAITGGGAEQSRLFGLGSQGLQNQIAVRSAPISEYNALTGAPGASATALTPDISGAFQQQLQSQLAGYNANVASNNATNSDVASAAMLAMLYFSDKRLKEDIKEVGKTEGGLPVYTYRFKGDPRTQMGVMAQDVEKEQPEAAFSLGGRGGVKMVNYGAIK
jgi:hypothetical protein